jgi:uncharacterized membrane protein YhhN
VLAAALVSALVVALLNWWSRLRPNPTMETITKPLVTVLVMWIAIAVDGPRGATTWAIVALAFCLVGDVALLDAIDRFIVGLAAFLIGHLVFIAMFVALGLDEPWWGLVAAALLAIHAATVGRRIVTGAATRDAGLRIPVTAYIDVITAMAIVGAMTGRWWAIVGAFAFVASDSILGWRAFVVEKKWMSVAVMMTYHVALVSLALSLG